MMMPFFMYYYTFRQQLRPGQRPGAHLLPHRLLLGRLLRAHGIPQGANHAEGVNMFNYTKAY